MDRLDIIARSSFIAPFIERTRAGFSLSSIRPAELRGPHRSPHRSYFARLATMLDSSRTMLKSRLPNVGTTIFTVMSALATRHGAVNLGQGFPDFACDPRLTEAVTRAMAAGHNQYPPMTGWPSLRLAIADKIERLYSHRYDPDSEITVTAGATQAILTTMLSLVHPGDEVIVIEPAYDSYVPAIEMAGAIPVFVQMVRDGDEFRIPWDSVRASITKRTRLIILNSPNNPTGMAVTMEDLGELERIVVEHGLFVASDEVYEHMLFDGRRHESVRAGSAGSVLKCRAAGPPRGGCRHRP